MELQKKKNITIEVWTDLYYSKFIAIWRPEEEETYEGFPPGEDPRPEPERNVPYLLVTSSTYKGRQEVVGATPIAMGQHPMPPEFLKQQTRHISYMFANEFGIFQPPTKIQAENLLAKERLGYRKMKEMKVEVSPAQGSMSLKEFRDMLGGYTEEELSSIKVMTVGENPQDAYAKGLTQYLHTPGNSTTEQYITVTKLANVYDVDDPYLSYDRLPTGTDKYVDEVLGHPLEQENVAQTEDAIASDVAELELVKTVDQIEQESMASDTAVTDIQRELTRDEIQQLAIKKLQAQLRDSQNI